MKLCEILHSEPKCAVHPLCRYECIVEHLCTEARADYCDHHPISKITTIKEICTNS